MLIAYRQNLGVESHETL